MFCPSIGALSTFSNMIYATGKRLSIVVAVSTNTTRPPSHLLHPYRTPPSTVFCKAHRYPTTLSTTLLSPVTLTFSAIVESRLSLLEQRNLHEKEVRHKKRWLIESSNLSKRSLIFSFDEHHLETQVNTAIQVEATSQEIFVAAEAKLADFKQILERQKREKYRHLNVLWSKHVKNETYIFEIETIIAHAYDDI
ncbi:unnamed protein product [Lactuca virosa]|uniref:Uncharacterized protein n=1 Tax=Lactuca virosa TaxID=75947 RepID=A0AAU9MVI5_9ASTR|nr:unnamed protein product [Lactuca virosa]